MSRLLSSLLYMKSQITSQPESDIESKTSIEVLASLFGVKQLVWNHSDEALVKALELKLALVKAQHAKDKIEALNKSVELMNLAVLAKIPGNLIPCIFGQPGQATIGGNLQIPKSFPQLHEQNMGNTKIPQEQPVSKYYSVCPHSGVEKGRRLSETEDYSFLLEKEIEIRNNNNSSSSRDVQYKPKYWHDNNNSNTGDRISTSTYDISRTGKVGSPRHTHKNTYKRSKLLTSVSAASLESNEEIDVCLINRPTPGSELDASKNSETVLVNNNQYKRRKAYSINGEPIKEFVHYIPVFERKDTDRTQTAESMIYLEDDDEVNDKFPDPKNHV